MKRFKFDKREFAGSLGDVGTLIPLFISLITINGLNPSVSLLLIGACYIFCGFYYNLPIPVQPLKAVAAIAIAKGLSVSVISSAGIWMGIILLFLSLTRGVNLIVRIFKPPIISGIQLGVGLMLIKTSFSLMTKQINVSQTNWISLGNGIPFNLVILFSGIIIMFIFLWNRCFPASISLLSFGIMVSLVSGQTNALIIPFFPIQKFNFSLPAFSDFIKAFFLLVIPQLPLTLGNAIVATKDVARRYFKDQAMRVSERSLSFSMAIANIFTGLFGGMPICHGSGGVTAHYSFGARTGGSSIIIGSLCLGLSLIFGNRISEVFKIIPHPLLGLMLFYVGIKHSLLIRDLKDKKGLLITLVMGITALFTGNLAIAYALGISFYFIYRAYLKRERV